MTHGPPFKQPKKSCILEQEGFPEVPIYHLRLWLRASRKQKVDSTWLKSLAQTGCYPSTHQGQGLWWEMAVNRSHKQWQAADLTLWFSAKSLPWSLGHLVTWSMVYSSMLHSATFDQWPWAQPLPSLWLTTNFTSKYICWYINKYVCNPYFR